MLEPETVLNDRYRLLEPLGEGGMAIVYRAVDTRLGRTVAVKVLHPQYARDEPFLTRFQQEAEFAASLGSHPNIVTIYDVGQDGAYHYIVMELVDGQNLKQVIRQEAPFSVERAFFIARQVALALEFAHKRGLVHRDIKPQNILVTDDGVAKVTDFGIARSATTSQLTRTGMVIGTVHYFSPEQAQGRPAGPASDIYSLGVILYEMLTGHLPFDAETPIGVAMQHLHSRPPSPWEYRRDLPAGVVAIVMRALEKDPERRYQSAGEMAGALTAVWGQEAGGTTALSPIVSPEPQRTSVYRSVEPADRTVRQDTPAVATAPAGPPGNRLPWIAGGLAVLIAALVAGSLFATGKIFAGKAATSTPTATATATPRPRRKPTPKPTATVPVAVIAPPPTPTVYVPPPTSTPIPPTNTPRPTSTPKPVPTPTPRAVASPTPSPLPQATPTGTGIG